MFYSAIKSFLSFMSVSVRSHFSPIIDENVAVQSEKFDSSRDHVPLSAVCSPVPYCGTVSSAAAVIFEHIETSFLHHPLLTMTSMFLIVV